MAGGFKEFMDATEGFGTGASDAPTLGNMQAEMGVPTVNTRIRYFYGSLDNDTDRLLLEDIMTTSLSAQAQLRKKNDRIVINEQGTFDKDGVYHVVVKYMELIDAPED